MAKPTFSTKRLQISKANSAVVVAAGLAAFVFIFSAVAVKALVSQMGYQNKVISAKRVAVNQLQADITATTSLKEAYDKFNGADKNVIGGSRLGNGPQDGNNAKIILDALPSSYDYPALTTSLEKLITNQNLAINSIGGVDDEVAQGNNQASPTPQPLEMPFTVGVGGSYANIQSLVNAFEKSIRPIQVKSITLSGDQSNLAMTLGATTYFQPGKSLNISSQDVK